MGPDLVSENYVSTTSSKLLKPDPTELLQQRFGLQLPFLSIIYYESMVNQISEERTIRESIVLPVTTSLPTQVPEMIKNGTQLKILPVS